MSFSASNLFSKKPSSAREAFTTTEDISLEEMREIRNKVPSNRHKFSAKEIRKTLQSAKIRF